jgi:hypothetical protein
MSGMDIMRAVTNVQQAALELGRVSRLPQDIGSRIKWTNGLVWERVGDDEWQPNDPQLSLDEARAGGWTAPSSHIASSGDWTLA